MERQPTAAVPLACIPAALRKSERPAHFALIQELFASAEESEPMSNGYGFRFVPESLDGIARFVSNERKCCPFLSFKIEVSPAGGAVWLRMSGPEGTKEFLERQFHTFRR